MIKDTSSYKIRLELLQLALDILIRPYEFEKDRIFVNADKCSGAIPREEAPEPPTTEQVIAEAMKLNTFVSFQQPIFSNTTNNLNV